MTPAEAGEADPGSSEPERTCIGCRRRDRRSSLLRTVAQDPRRPDGSAPTGTQLVRPDPASRLPGRGAWIHPTTECLEQATRRRAFGRALRLRTGADLTQVRAFVEAWQVEHEA